jgi:hypothetical protein
MATDAHNILIYELFSLAYDARLVKKICFDFLP